MGSMNCNYLKKAKRIVVKIGSALVVNNTNRTILIDKIESLSKEISILINDNKEVMLVTSGAVALGRNSLGLKNKNLTLQEKQAAAANGQVILAHAWRTALARNNIVGAQVLLSHSDAEIRRNALNARNTLETLMKLKSVAIINENDTVATAELRYGDNDRLAARVAQISSAEVLVLLSDVSGLYNINPMLSKKGKLIKKITDITPEIESMAGGKISKNSSGGMITKLQAAKIALATGCHMAITSGKIDFPLTKLSNGEPATWFVSSYSPNSARKSWIASQIEVNGKLLIDEGAYLALLSGSSLLPAGVLNIFGSFERGDVVEIVNNKDVVLGRGMIAYSSDDAALIKGHKSEEIENLLGYSGRNVLIHRDDMVIK